MNTPQTWSDSPIHEQIRKMNDTPTPEIDEHEFPCMTWPSRAHPMVVRSDFARKLERELITVTKQRDEAVNNYESAQLLSIRVGEQRDDYLTELRIVTERLKGNRHPDDNGIMADGEIDVKEIIEQRDEAREELAMWKSNHDNQVALKSMLMQRPDLGDRASQIAAVTEQRDKLIKAIKPLEYWRDISECDCSCPLPQGGCLRCDLNRILEIANDQIQP